MSFLRPGAAAALGRWGEAGLVGAALAGSVWLAGAWLAAGSLFGWIALGVAALLALWLRSALAGAMSRLGREGPGVVVLREGEVGYMGPQGGGFLDLATIQRIEIVTPSRGEPLWYLDAGADGRLIFPASAEGADRLIETLDALPGFSDLAAARMLSAPPPGRHVVWQRHTAPRLAPR